MFQRFPQIYPDVLWLISEIISMVNYYMKFWSTYNPFNDIAWWPNITAATVGKHIHVQADILIQLFILPSKQRTCILH